MATIETPPSVDTSSGNELHEVPVLLVQLQDDLARSRMREAFWMSLFFHLLLAILLATSTKWMPSWGTKAVVVATPQELINQRQLTYLDLPPDAQKITKRPNTDVISDKNRIASSRAPHIDHKELRKILDSGRPGAPGPGGLPGRAVQPSPPQQQVAQAQPGQQQQNPSAQQGGQTAQPPSQTAKLESVPPVGAGAGAFGTGALSPGRAIEQAARAAAARPGGGYGGGGDYGIPGSSQGRVKSDIDILSDTAGVDFGPYLSRVLHDVRLNWYNLIPEVARAPLMKRGKVSIEFAIMKDGSVAGMKLTSASGDVSLDRAAWGGITGSNPFPPLPGEFRGNYLALRFHFFYNPDRNEMR